MFRSLLNLVKGFFFLGCLLLLSFQTNGQSCCPLPGTCSPCAGGISALTLRYHGFVPAYLSINDGSSPALFSDWILPGETITIRGRSSGNFSGNFIYLRFNPTILHTQIRVNCGLEFDPFTYFGLFTIVSAESKNGGVMCCTSNTGSVTPPEIFGCPSDVTVSTIGGCNATAIWSAPTAPACDVVSLTSSHTSGASFPLGTTQVTYTARNSANLTSTCTFQVHVTDATRPTVKTPTANLVVNAGSECKSPATWIAPQFVDNCGTVASVTSTHTPGAIFPLGATTVTYTAKDAAGNAVTSSFTVTVKDAAPPTVSNCPADIALEPAVGCTAVATWTPPLFSDACSAITVTSTHKPGESFAAGISTVTYSAKDVDGNETTCSFKVTVKDKSIPVFTSCPADTTISTTAVGSVRYSWIAPVATDECVPPILTSNHQPGEQFPIGITTVVYTAKDVSGNVSTCSFDINVKQEHTKLDVPQLLTPDGNTVNDSWIIGNIELYKENKVMIVDRWGSVIYTETGYNNEGKVWKGRNTQGSVVPSGTYFFTISIRSGNQNSETRGFIEVVR